MTDATPSRRFRVDIQVMRAVAVIAVVIYHAGFGLLPGGYLGVDIFFVISGYLMGGIILRELDEHRFSLADFYMRRAVRLLPASLSTLFFTTIIAAVMLTWSAWEDFLKQLLGSLTFTANYALMLQVSYFDAKAETKPLLHMWSLSLEEQFYLLLPITLMLFSKRLRLPALVLGVILSSALCWALVVGVEALPFSVRTQQSLAFYSLPARAWEMLLGCSAASVLLRRPSLRLPAQASWVALAVIVFVIAFPLSSQHPGADAMIATLAMTALLFSRGNWLPSGAVTDLAVKIGDWSYSIYLVHWPLFAFATTYFLKDAPAAVNFALVPLSVVLGWMQYRFVEQPFRTDRKQRRTRKALGYAGATVLVGATAFALSFFAYTPQQRIERLGPRFGLAPSCDIIKPEWTDSPLCSRGPSPTIALWGDSFAMHWNPALADMVGERGLVQITKSGCAPARGIAQINRQHHVQWARTCIAFNEDVLEKLAARREIDTVILASAFTQVFSVKDGALYRRGERIEASVEAPAAALAETIAALRRAGKRVIVIEPTPVTGVDYGACAVRRLSDRPTAPSVADCAFRLSEALALYGRAYTAIERVAKEQGARYVRPRDVLCPGGRCRTVAEGHLLYRDEGHLTEFGSNWVLNRLNLFEEAGEGLAPVRDQST